jgi:multidrug efflux system membrane fusion protein
MDALPPELVEKLKAMPPEERRAYLQKLRERRQQRESGG